MPDRPAAEPGIRKTQWLRLTGKGQPGRRPLPPRRAAFLVGPVLALVIIFVRRHLPESPRWQIRPTEQIGYLALLRSLFKHYPSRSIYGGTPMITQSFLHNAIFFTYGLVLLYFFHVPSKDTPYYFMAFCAGNLLGPLTIGRLFDTIGRRKMISGTYLLSGVLLVITAQLFKAGALNAVTQTLCWTVIFYFASAGASAGHLTVSEIFALEVRAKAIAVFFAIAQCFGSFGSSLEDVAKPLGVIAGSAEGIFRSGDPRQGGAAAGD